MKRIYQFAITALVVLLAFAFVGRAVAGPEDIIVGGTVDLFPPPVPEGCLTWAGETLCPPGVEPPATSTPEPEPEAVTCHIDGCAIPIVFVTAEGAVAKTMVITFVDAAPIE